MMLSELVIAKGGATGGDKKESLTKQEVNDILKFGAENLFKDTEEGQGNNSEITSQLHVLFHKKKLLQVLDNRFHRVCASVSEQVSDRAHILKNVLNL